MTTFLGNILLGLFCAMTFVMLISMVQTIWYDHKRAKYDEARDVRDEEYHQQRMKNLR